MRHFLLAVNWYWASITHRLRDTCIFLYQGHDLDLLGSRDVIGHVTILCPIMGFLLVLHWNQVPVCKRFRDIRLQSACPMQFVIAHARAISRDLYPLCKILAHIWFPTPTLPIQYDSYWVPMKNKGCLLVRPTMLNANSSENFLSPDQNWENFGGFGGLRFRDFKKLRFLPQKERPCVKRRPLSHFASKSVEEKKSESHRGSHRKDMSPLTQGLKYRSACDKIQMIKYTNSTW